MKLKKCSILLNEDTYQTNNSKERKQSYKSTILFFILPCGMKFLLEFILAERLYFVFCRNKFLLLGKIGVSCWESIFAIFRKYPIPSIDNIFVFIEKCNTNIYFRRILHCTSVFHCILFLNERDKS